MTRHVQNFESDLLCFMRPRKRTLCILQYIPPIGVRIGRWSPYMTTVEQPTCSFHRSNPGAETIQAKLFIGSRTGSTHEVVYELNGNYIRWTQPGQTPKNIPILGTRISGIDWPVSFKKNDSLRLPSYTAETFVRPDTLWILRPIEVPAVQQQQNPKPLPSRIARLIAEDASVKAEMCPITMETINPQTAKVTSCYHVFDGQAIDEWLSTKNTCPVCKQVCSAVATAV